MRTFFAAAFTLVFVTLVLGVAGCSKDSASNPYSASPTAPPPTTTTPPPSPNTVLMAGMAFNPVTLTVPAGTTVTWKNNDGFAHTSTSDNGTWSSGSIAGGKTYSFTFTTAGTYPYTCTFHAAMGMKGTIVVQ